MACGTPVIASNAASLPEILGDDGLLVDPRSEATLTRALTATLVDLDLRVSLAHRGLCRAGVYSWQRAANETIQVYEEAVANHTVRRDDSAFAGPVFPR